MRYFFMSLGQSYLILKMYSIKHILMRLDIIALRSVRTCEFKQLWYHSSILLFETFQTCSYLYLNRVLQRTI